MSAPAFIAVLPVEVEDYGPAAAIVIALIRYRTATAGPDRIERDGHRWWRVTHRQLAHATGLSPKAVRTALQALGDAVTAKHFAPLSNQTLSYRVAKTPNPLAYQLPERADADLPVARAGSPDAPGGTDRAAAGTPPRPSGHLYLSLETLEKGGEAAAPRADTELSDSANNEPAAPVPDQFGNGLSENPLAINDPMAPADAGRPSRPTEFSTWVRGPYGPRCRRHANVEHPPNCPGCGEARITAKADDVATEARVAADRAAALAARERITRFCNRCDEAGWLLGPDGVVLDDAVRCDHRRESEMIG